MGPITDAHKLTYQRNMQLALQQIKSKLDAAFEYTTGLSGRLAQMLELYGATTAVKDLPRNADTPNIDSPVEPVWCKPTQLAWGKILELEDAIKAVMDPKSQFIKAGAAAMVRGKDEVLRDAVFAQRRIGQDGATLSSWAGDTVAKGIGSSDDLTDTGMNVKKLIRGLRYMQSRQVDIDQEQLFCQVNAQGMEELYRDLTYINKDYRDRAVLEGKQVREILNITIIPADGAAAQANFDGTTYQFPMWCKSGLLWGEFSPFRTDMPLRADKMNRPHPHSEHWIGATRSEDFKVVKILSKI